MRKVWREYLLKIDAIVYLVDVSAPERFPDSKKEFDKVVFSDELRNVPILILGNKIDKQGAVNEETIREVFGLTTNTSFGQNKVEKINGKKVEVFMCSVVKKAGFKDGFNWLTK